MLWVFATQWALGSPLPAERFAVTESAAVVPNSVNLPEPMRFRAGAWTPPVVQSAHRQIVGAPRVDPTWQVDQWRTEHGLPQNEIRQLHQTRDGYLWIGTSHGLARFDGRRFVTFDSRTDSRLDGAHQDIRSFAEDPDGGLWIGTAGGILRWAANHLRVIPNPAGDGAFVVNHLSLRRAGGLWVSTRRGLHVFQQERWQEWSHSLGAEGRVSLAAEAPDGALVWSDTKGLKYRPDPDAPTVGPVNNPHLTGAALAAHLNPEGHLWLGMENGIGTFNRQGILEVVPPEVKWFSDHQQFTPALCTDSTGQIWIACGRGPNLHRWIGERLAPFPEPERSRIHEVSALASDRNEGIWVGTRTSGLFRVRPHPLTTLLVEAPMHFENVRTVTGAPDGSLWMGTDAGAVHWGANGVELFDFRLTQAEPTIRTLPRARSRPQTKKL